MSSDSRPHLLLFSTLFPSVVQPQAGLFIRERMFRVARELPLQVVSPQPWFPGQGLIRRFRPGYRPQAPAIEQQQGITIHHPRFLALPAIGRRWDGLSMALCCWPLLRRLRAAGQIDLIDAHFGYPDGYAAVLLGRWLKRPVTITLRGTEVPHAQGVQRNRLRQAVTGATQLFTVSDSLRRLALELGAAPERLLVVPNGVDRACFHPLDRQAARAELGLPAQARILITVGGLVERKGFHRVIAALPTLLQRHPQLHYLLVGGPCAEGNIEPQLREQVKALGLEGRVHFLGALPPQRLRLPLSAADLFVLPTRNEGWANVLLEALACGLPVVASDVGGNAEVINDPRLGTIVALEDQAALVAAIDAWLGCEVDHGYLANYVGRNGWEQRVSTLVQQFRRLAGHPGNASATECLTAKQSEECE
ncbi:MAG TPA: glycosyltransferase [Pseudomonadales bacterium]|jgi:teichuronic acid biosynthesis glycosyltransferase TuaC|nr:glycosyltransferase [Pseudomonadales bacterium]HMW84003.1 glycosyltransferase [Pseudomonadales bacterium]HMY96988.1 glycosyltransferase [Pseudomonadales bacterium]HMZ70932.1 glycosyltransferase [Pseudomonadales bacterium]HNC76723.1 glycosyltransferase [Pseudomonadales bacterium]